MRAPVLRPGKAAMMKGIDFVPKETAKKIWSDGRERTQYLGLGTIMSPAVIVILDPRGGISAGARSGLSSVSHNLLDFEL
ncbi:hypothetical protein NDU88_007374 [Pleurodeles waltl]|uniref:Uncharacterized protein n=1 Tax=Pleurodeles waltl TaxID=8319 RepID=A0AAV7N440_PLEWA|nr:hypothetical protein NDU88_007374 [Pleurodeles waltl]